MYPGELNAHHPCLGMPTQPPLWSSVGSLIAYKAYSSTTPPPTLDQPTPRTPEPVRSRWTKKSTTSDGVASNTDALRNDSVERLTRKAVNAAFRFATLGCAEHGAAGFVCFSQSAVLALLAWARAPLLVLSPRAPWKDVLVADFAVLPLLLDGRTSSAGCPSPASPPTTASAAW